MSESVIAGEAAREGKHTWRVSIDPNVARAALLVCIGYYLGAQIGVALTLKPHPVSTLWPPNSILLAALLLTPVRSWWVILLGAFPAHLAVQLPLGIPLPMTLSWFVSNTSEALIGAGLIRHLIKGPLQLDSFRSVTIFFVAAAFLGPFLSSFLDAAVVTLNRFGQGSYWEVWSMRFFSNVAAALTIVPAILALGARRSASERTAGERGYLEPALLTVALLVVCFLVFTRQTAGPNTAPALLYAPLPLLLWAAVRFGPGGTSAYLLIFALIAISGATRGTGPFVTSSPQENALSVQLFLIVIAVPLLTIAAVMQERRRAEEETRGNEERLQLALNAAQVGIWEWQIPRNGGAWSDRSKVILGLTDGTPDLTLHNFLSSVSPEDRPAVSHAIRRAMDEGAPYEVQFRVAVPGRGVRWVMAQGKALYDEAGRPVRMLGVNVDITERKRSEEALRESERRLSDTLTNVDLIAVMLDIEGNVTFLNDYLARLTGWERHQAIGSNWFEAFLPDDVKETVERAFQNGLQTGLMSIHTENEIKTRTGERRLVKWTHTTLRDATGRVLGVTCLGEDITDRKRADQALRSSEERFGKAFRSSPDAIAISRQSDDTILEINDRWEAMLGYSREEVLGRTPAELGVHITDSDYDRLRDLVRTQGSLREHELALRTKTGQIREGALAIDTVEMAGEPCFITIIRDVTERKRAELESQEQRRELAHLGRVSLLGELSGALAHELSQPLSAILANARAAQRLLGKDSPDLRELGEILEDIAKDDRRAGEVIHRLRTLLKKGEMQPRAIDLNEEVAEVLKLVHSDLIRRRVSTNARLGSSLPPVVADRVQVQQVLLNLILNACDAMSAKSPSKRQLTIATSVTDEGWVQLSVADQGTGIPAEKMEEVFQPFVTSKEDGLGLGLTICRSIVTAHGGRLWVINNEDGGATFHLVLLREPQPIPADRQHRLPRLEDATVSPGRET